MTIIRQGDELQPGDYYGTVYKGSLIIPLLGLILTGVAIWYVLRKRER